MLHICPSIISTIMGRQSSQTLCYALKAKSIRKDKLMKIKTRKIKQNKVQESYNSRAFDLLPDKQRWFVLEYITHYNATKAARDAGYSRKYAGIYGFRLKNQELVKTAISELEKERVNEIKITAEKVLADLEHQRKLALRYGQIMAANKASELMGRSIALFVNRSQYDLTPDQVELAHNFPQILQQAQADVRNMIELLAGEDLPKQEEESQPKSGKRWTT
jgi:hypothetical protein